MFGPLVALALLYVFTRWVYPQILLLAAVLAGFALLTRAAEQMLRGQLRRRGATLEYHD